MKTRLIVLLVAGVANAPAQPADRDIPIDNSWVRVVQVHRAMPGVKTRPHRHTMNRVMIYLNAGGQDITYEDGKVEKLVWKAGQALWSPAGGMHVAEIKGTEPARIVEVELKREGRTQPAPAARSDPARQDRRHFTTDLANPQVQVVRLRLGPGEKTKFVDQRGPRLVTYLTAHDLTVTANTGAARRERHDAGKVEWVEMPEVAAIENAGTAPAEAVVIYFNR